MRFWTLHWQKLTLTGSLIEQTSIFITRNALALRGEVFRRKGTVHFPFKYQTLTKALSWITNLSWISGLYTVFVRTYWDRDRWSREAWWRHQMEKFSELLAICEGNSPVTGEFPSQRPVMRSFDIFFDLNKRLSKQSRCLDFRRHRPIMTSL